MGGLRLNRIRKRNTEAEAEEEVRSSGSQQTGEGAAEGP